MGILDQNVGLSKNLKIFMEINPFTDITPLKYFGSFLEGSKKKVLNFKAVCPSNILSLKVFFAKLYGVEEGVAYISPCKNERIS